MSFRRGGVVLVLVLLVIGAALLVAGADPDERIEADGPPDERMPIDEPFEWSDAEVIEHLGLTRDGHGYLYASDSSAATCRVDAILTSAMEVDLHDASGSRTLTNPSGFAGLAWSLESIGIEAELNGGRSQPPACAELTDELAARLETLRPGTRTAAEKATDLAAVDHALLAAAQVAAGHQPPIDPEWPGIEGTIGDGTVTLTGSSLGRCRQVVVTADRAISAPSSC